MSEQFIDECIWGSLTSVKDIVRDHPYVDYQYIDNQLNPVYRQNFSIFMSVGHNGYLPLVEALKNDEHCVSITEYLLKNGAHIPADLLNREGIIEYMFDLIAEWGGDDKISLMSLLFDYGIFTHQRLSTGDTIFDMAVKTQELSTIYCLLNEYGFSILRKHNSDILNSILSGDEWDVARYGLGVVKYMNYIHEWSLGDFDDFPDEMTEYMVDHGIQL